MHALRGPTGRVATVPTRFTRQCRTSVNTRCRDGSVRRQKRIGSASLLSRARRKRVSGEQRRAENAPRSPRCARTDARAPYTVHPQKQAQVGRGQRRCGCVSEIDSYSGELCSRLELDSTRRVPCDGAERLCRDIRSPRGRERKLTRRCRPA